MYAPPGFEPAPPLPARPLDPTPLPARPLDPTPLPARPLDPTPLPARPLDPTPLPARPLDPIPLPARPLRRSCDRAYEEHRDAVARRPLPIAPYSRYAPPAQTRRRIPSSVERRRSQPVYRPCSPPRARSRTGPTGALIPPIGYRGVGEWHCGVCDVTAWDEGAFEQHTSGKKHKNAMWYYEEGAVADAKLPDCIKLLQDGYYYCEFCEAKMTSLGSVQMHLSGKNHIKAEKYLATNAQGMLVHDTDFREHYVRQFYKDGTPAEFGIVPRGTSYCGLTVSFSRLMTTGIAPSHWAEVLHCPLCDQKPATWGSWSSHCSSKRHMSRVEELSSQYYCYWIRLNSGGVEYFFDLVTGLWQTQRPLEMDVPRAVAN
ncbi:hypothetical protein FOZ60_004204 [Perkinsus olseni]|uniref:C2H2-type domain-containing protein n=1 Tax=Perkinsus olseni TaxID=32597 RepID=A0A7J6NUK9_PEROL|nr:hypothetical protein FOZ60_004204 [Perkinsus olseni]